MTVPPGEVAIALNMESEKGGSINNFHTVLVPTTPKIAQCMPALNVLKGECLKITICHEEQS